MKKTKFTESQIVSAIKKQESGISVKEISRELSISEATLTDLKNNLRKYGMDGAKIFSYETGR